MRSNYVSYRRPMAEHSRRLGDDNNNYSSTVQRTWLSALQLTKALHRGQSRCCTYRLFPASYEAIIALAVLDSLTSSAHLFEAIKY